MLSYYTDYGKCFKGDVKDILNSALFEQNVGKINLIITSPPFPLNRKKKYGNLNGSEYIEWLSEITSLFYDYLTDDGSFVIEIGNAWEKNEPLMSTLPLEALLAIKNYGKYKLCQQFVWYNTAKLPGPVQWVNKERCRVKDSFTNIWWFSKTAYPKANNKNVLQEYGGSMKKLLLSKKYNSGKRPSDHSIGCNSFLKENGGAIPSNVLVGSNTVSNSCYLSQCKNKGINPHPARMPEYIVEFFVKFLTDTGDLVFDPFSGSNTSGSVCEKLERKWLSVEINMDYIESSKFRFNNVYR